jgi:hypothetical protein
MMRFSKLLSIVLLLSIAAPIEAIGDESTVICGSDISDFESPFKWQVIQDDVPIYLAPGDTKKIYQQFLNAYRENLTLDDATRDEVRKFVSLQESIISGMESAQLSIKAGPMSGDELLSGHKLIFPFPCADIGKNYLVDISYLAIAYKKVHDASFEVLRDAANKTIQLRNRQYQDWFDNGLPMWPQETWFNGLFLGESDADKPAKHQWVVFRPSVGLGGNSNGGITDSNLEATLGVEIGGFVRYLKADYSDYWGLSVLATLGEDAGVGYGLLLRYNDYVFGYSKRNEDASLGISDDNEYLYIGYDLYKLVHEKKDEFRQYKRKVRKTISEYQ